jgi:Fic family protein
MAFNRQKPYNNLPNLPPSQDLETVPILKRCIDAASALAELKGMGDVIPNQDLVIRSIGLQEARVSSEIENIVTTTDDLYRALADTFDKATPQAKEVLRYQEAISTGFDMVKSRAVLSTSLFCELATIIKQCEMPVRKLPGTKIVDMSKDEEVIYTPPEGEHIIRDKLKNLEEFIHANDGMHPLIKLAVMHYQFEAIHPFTDGNGRTGRIINILYLIQQDLLKQPVLYLSSYFIEHKTEYYSKLRSVTEKAEWEPWINFVLDAVHKTANRTKDKILGIKALMDSTQEEIRTKARQAYSKDLVELLFYLPYCKARFLEERELVSRNTAMTRLRSLESAGILQSLKFGRDVYFINKRLLNFLAQP